MHEELLANKINALISNNQLFTQILLLTNANQKEFKLTEVTTDCFSLSSQNNRLIRVFNRNSTLVVSNKEVNTNFLKIQKMKPSRFENLTICNIKESSIEFVSLSRIDKEIFLQEDLIKALNLKKKTSLDLLKSKDSELLELYHIRDVLFY